MARGLDVLSALAMDVDRTFVRPRVVALESIQDDTVEDREMQCGRCATRIFSSRASKLVANGFRCPRCLAPVTLVPTTDVR